MKLRQQIRVPSLELLIDGLGRISNIQFQAFGKFESLNIN